ncbi:FHA domain-containing protein [Cellulomonas iranensis]|uniref:FHA domain-containing protein n=1 Tax=Cellulomonas iranensis TaxID=76862 RepID=UPI003D7DED43
MTETPHHEYQDGQWTAVTGAGFLALVEPDAPAHVVDGLWRVARGDGDVLGALGVVAADGFASLPRFAVVRTDADGAVHAVLRGPLLLRLHGADEVQEVAAGDGAVWTEHRALGVRGLVLVTGAAQEPAASWWPLVGGVVRAAGLRTGQVHAEQPAADAAPLTHEQPVVEQVPSAPVAGPAPAAAAEPAPAVEPVVVEPVAPTEHVAPAVPVVAPEPVAAPEPVVAPEPVAPVVASAGEDDAWSGGIAWPTAAEVEPEPVADPSPAATATPEEAPWWQVGTASRPSPDPEPQPAAAAPADVPAAVAAVAPVATVAPDDEAADDHDGMTILSSDLARLRDRLPTWSQDAVPGPFPAPEPAPLPARLVLSTGLVVALDRAVLLGRAPQVARVTNRELPRLVTVPSPNQDISRTHAEVRTEGEHVVVTDLDSTNGVHVSRPGQGVRRLHPGEPSVVGTDEVVDLGDGVTFTVERSA